MITGITQYTTDAKHEHSVSLSVTGSGGGRKLCTEQTISHILLPATKSSSMIDATVASGA